MHRSIRVPRSLYVATLLSVIAYLGLGIPRTDAQQPTATTVVVPTRGTQILEMSKKQRIRDIDNKDEKVARVEFLKDSDFRKVMIYGGDVPGAAQLVLTDTDGNKESFTILVEINLEFLRRVLAQAAPTANIQITQGTGGTLILTGTVSQATDIEIITKTAVGTVGGNPNLVVNAMRLGGVQQIQLDVVIARVARSQARSMGFSFLQNGTNHFIASTVGTSTNNLASSLTNGAGTVTSTLLGAPNIVFGVLEDNSAFMGFLEALRTESLVKVLAQPKVTTISGKPAMFISGGKQAVPQLASGSAGGGAVSGVEFVPFGTTVNFLPLVLADGRIYLEVQPAFDFPDPSNLFSTPISGTTGVVYGRTTQSIQTSAVLAAGQTLAIGGMVFHSVNGSTTKVPVLGDLPFLGVAFSTTSYSESEEEVLILITPHLIDPLDCAQLPGKLPGEETRSPDDFELFLERILEAPRGPRQVFHDHKYVPAYRNGPTANMFPCTTCNGAGNCDLGQSASPVCGYCNNQQCGAGGSCGQAGGCGTATSVIGSSAIKGQPLTAPAQGVPVNVAKPLPMATPATTPLPAVQGSAQQQQMLPDVQRPSNIPLPPPGLESRSVVPPPGPLAPVVRPMAPAASPVVPPAPPVDFIPAPGRATLAAPISGEGLD